MRGRMAGVAFTAGLAAANLGCGGGSGEVFTHPRDVDAVVEALNGGAHILAIATDEIVLPQDGIRGEEAAYWPVRLGLASEAGQLVVAQCGEEGDLEFDNRADRWRRASGY